MVSPHTALVIPRALIPGISAPNRLRFRRLLRDNQLWGFLTESLRQSRSASVHDRIGMARELRADWLLPWMNIGGESASDECSWLSDLVDTTCHLITSDITPTGDASTVNLLGSFAPEARISGMLLAQDAVILSTPVRKVHIPVVFVLQSADQANPVTPPEQVARLELRLVDGAAGVHVHPSDRWRRTVKRTVLDFAGVPHEVDGAGPANQDFLQALSDAFESARVYWDGNGTTIRQQGVVWRLLDFDSDQPFRWQGQLQGPSLGGAALRGFLHLLQPREEEIEKYVFVLGQLRDTGGRRTEVLQPVSGVRQKIANAVAAVGVRAPALRHCAFFVLPRKPESGDFPEGVGAEQVIGMVDTAASLALLRSPLQLSKSKPKNGRGIALAGLAFVSIILCMAAFRIQRSDRNSAVKVNDPGMSHPGAVGFFKSVSADELKSALNLVQTQWRLAQISNERIDSDLQVTLTIYKTQQQSGLNMADVIASTERAIAAEKAKIGQAVEEISQALVTLVPYYKRNPKFLDDRVDEAERDGRKQAVESLTHLRTILSQVPADSAHWSEHFKQSVGRQLIPNRP